MRVGINGRFLVAKRTGVQRAAYNLVRTLIAIDRNNEYFLFTSRSQVGNPDWDFANVTVVPSSIKEGESSRANLFRNHFWEQITLPRLCAQHKIDVLHSPANLAPLLYRGKSIIHIHDLCFVVNPRWYSFSFRTLYNFLIPRLARKASKVTTNSNNSRNDLLQFCAVPADKVSVVYWAVDDLFMRAEGGDAAEPLPDEEREDYILYVGSLEPRKNIRTLVEAYEALRLANPEINTKLVLIGGENPLFGDMRLKVRRFTSDVVFKGFVDDDLLRRYYRRARLVVYPSLYEGFGLPPLEAMASGTPVVTSRTSSLPEVVGDAALMVSPYDIQQLSEVMTKVLRDPELRSRLITRGVEQVRRFNWYRVARNILTVYHEVYHSNGQGLGREHQYLPIAEWRRLRDQEASVYQSV